MIIFAIKNKLPNMANIASFTFSPFQENTYVIYDETKECIIIDPGCYDSQERNILVNFIAENNLRPVRLVNTHCHIDHVFGNAFVAKKYNLKLEAHKGEEIVLAAAEIAAKMYGLKLEHSPDIEVFLEEGETLRFGNTTFQILFTPGHSPASLSFFCREDKFVIAGDVLFRQSIGRTDLPGGNFDTLMKSIREKLLPLGDEVQVFSGHGESTTIGYERVNNPFLTGRYTL